MKSLMHSPKFVSLPAVGLGMFLSLIVFSSPTLAQRKEISGKRATVPSKLSIEQQDALDLMKTQAQDIRSEPDKPAVSAVQARIADILWQFDEPFARELFVWAFEAALQPPPEAILKSKRPAYIARQAASIREVLHRLGRHDSKLAETWVKTIQEEKLAAERSSGKGPMRSELLLQIALQLVATNAEQAQRLGLASLSGSQIPEGFGQLLFSLSNVSRGLSDELFRAGMATLRRNDFVYDKALIVFTNYLFAPGGDLRSDAAPADAELLANYFVDATWHQPGGAGIQLTESSAQFFSLLQVRGIPIVARHRPDRLPELEGQRRHLAVGLTQEQAQRTTLLASLQDQQRTVASRNSYEIDEQIERAEKQKDSQVRDPLFSSIAHSLMRQDGVRALKVADKIEDEEVRRTTQDDINLVRVQSLLAAKAYEEVRQTALKFNNVVLQARVLARLANKVLTQNKDTGRAGELLTEANDITSKTDNTPDKALSLLLIADQFATFDEIRGFEALESAIKTVNRLNDYEPAPKSVLAKPRLLTIKTFTVIAGNEMSATESATLEAIDFSQIRPFVTLNYLQTRSLANHLEKRLLRAKFLTALADSTLSQPPPAEVSNTLDTKLPANGSEVPAANTSSGLVRKQQSRIPK